MSDVPSVAVVISTYREIADGRRADAEDSKLARAVRSVLAQTFTDWELVIVSDQPPAADLAALEGYVRRLGDPRVRHHTMDEHGGIQLLGSACKRAGIEHSRAPLIAFLEADNAWDAGFLGRGVRAFQQDPSLDLVYHDTLVRLEPSASDPLPFALWMSAEFVWHKPDWDRRSRRMLEHYNFVDASDAMFRRDTYQAAGPLPLRVDSDWLLWRRFLRGGRDRFRHIPAIGSYFATTSWRQHANYFGLTLIQRFDIPFDMRERQYALRQERDAAYGRKHQT
jgi:glycosyltransferase involved in cell wall biosynthesis